MSWTGCPLARTHGSEACKPDAIKFWLKLLDRGGAGVKCTGEETKLDCRPALYCARFLGAVRSASFQQTVSTQGERH